MALKLMIVESPTKARKIASILGAGWRVEASMGHIVDLPPKEMAIEPETYQLSYAPSERGADVIARLKPLTANASAIYLATDPDREGEAISAHLKRFLGISRYFRVTFNEITETGIRAALAAPRPIDRRLVAAQEARRAADRLIGYRVSMPVSTAAGRALSVGRCQSPATRLVVERQEQIDQFKPTSHFTAQVDFEGGTWNADWQTKPFLREGEDYILDRQLAEQAASCRHFAVRASVEKPLAKGPPAPFTTSTLLQAAGATLGYAPDLTQKLAQKLFEAGLITYHRTDNPNLSADGTAAIRAYADRQGWPLVEKPRRWPLPEGAQEAHEAIRPTHVEDAEAGDDDALRALYALVWRRAVASQLADALYRTVTLDLSAEAGGHSFSFRARSVELTRPGWKTIIAAEKSDDEDEEEATSGRVHLLPVGSQVTATAGRVVSPVTKPPKRYTETSLIRRLEQMGIGRPSTFAAIVANIKLKKYVVVQKRFLAPTPAGRAVVRSLVGRFDFAEFAFTKDLERRLDLIAEGQDSYLTVVSELDRRLDAELGRLAAIKPEFPCPKCDRAMRLITTKRGSTERSFFGCSGYREGCTVICEDDGGRPGPLIERSEGPSEKQLAFARNLAAENGLAVPLEAQASAKTLSAWIDHTRAAAPPRLASEGQRQFVATLLDGNPSLTPPEGWPDQITSAAAKTFIDQNAKATRIKGQGAAGRASAKAMSTRTKKASRR